MSRSQHDQFIDDDDEEESCPLCVEELDITDKNFRPCPCGYQICQFCYNNIKTTMNGLCPACRRPYDDKNIQWKAVTQEEMLLHKQNLAQQAKKKAAAKQKEAQKREADNLSRKHLAGLRVRQKNLVYVTGMKPKIQGDQLIELLRGPTYFGQYGNIIKIVVASPSKPTQQSIGIYITFARNEDAATCIDTVNHHYGDGTIRAQFGTTKYCSAYLRGETCNNRNCMFLHEPGDENERYTRQDLSSLNAISTQQPTGNSSDAQGMRSQTPSYDNQSLSADVLESNDSVLSNVEDADELPALPPTVSWANQARRLSRTTSGSNNSPASTTPAPIPSALASASRVQSPEVADSSLPEMSAPKAKVKKTRLPYLDDILKNAFDPTMCFSFSAEHLSEQEREGVELMPQLWDPSDAVRRREHRQRAELDLQRKQLADAQASAQVASFALESDEALEAGSSALGGEPEDSENRRYASQGLIQPPMMQHIGGASFGLGDLDQELARIGDGRTFTPLENSEGLPRLFKDPSMLGGPQQFGTTSFGHGRHGSRFNFSSETGATTTNDKASGNVNPAKHQGSALGQNNQFPGANQQAFGNQFYTSSVQGPPPGLKSTTPSISGGGMFGQGHGFTTGLAAYGGNARDNDKSWDQSRNQRVGAPQADSAKHNLPLLGQALPAELSPSAESYANDVRRPISSRPPGLPLPASHGDEEQDVEKVHGHRPTAVRARHAPAERPSETISQPIQVPVTTAEAVKVKLTETVDNNPLRIADSIKQNKDVIKASPTKQVQSPKKTLNKDRLVATAGESDTKKEKAISEASVSTKDIASKQIRRSAAPRKKSEIEFPSKQNELNSAAPENDETVSSTVSKDAVPRTRASRATSVASPDGSRPHTPTITSLVNNSPIKRSTQPRTLRITGTPTIETLQQSSASITSTTVFSVVTPATKESKAISRRASVASIQQPPTPTSDVVDTASLTSANVSRASSPPPAEKHERKKEKKEKRKASTTSSVTTPAAAEIEEVAPLVGRKRKAKKAGPNPTPKLSAVASAVDTLYEESPDSPNPVTGESTPRDDHFEDKASSSRVPAPHSIEEKSPSSERTPSIASILSTLEGLLQNSAHTAALLKPVHQSRHSTWLPDHASATMELNSDVHNHLQQLAFELTESERASLLNGKPARRDTGDERVSGRNLVTPSGDRYSCLSQEEEDRVLRLEAKLSTMQGQGAWGGATRTNIPKSALRSGVDMGTGASFPPYPLQDMMTHINAYIAPTTNDNPLFLAPLPLLKGGADPGEAVTATTSTLGDVLDAAGRHLTPAQYEKIVLEAWRLAEGHERKLNSLIKRNKKVVLSGGRGEH